MASSPSFSEHFAPRPRGRRADRRRERQGRAEGGRFRRSTESRRTPTPSVGSNSTRAGSWDIFPNQELSWMLESFVVHLGGRN